MGINFVIGGARSGKSAHALALCEAITFEGIRCEGIRCDAIAPARIFIATAEAYDDEMRDRIKRHQQDRGQGWSTIEAPLDLAGAIDAHAGPNRICLVDCLTLWLSNVMHAERSIDKETDQLCRALTGAAGPVTLVSNEVGMGLVPETPLGRRFRDAQGRLNQTVAAISDSVQFVAAGLPIKLKG